jgi:TPR repeat protein
MYAEGQGLTQDYKEAVEWYRLAAEQGYAAAQGMLGMMYKDGQGVLQDNVYAHMWTNIAASNGNEIAAENRDLYASKLTPSQLEKAQDLARACVKKSYKGC